LPAAGRFADLAASGVATSDGGSDHPGRGGFPATSQVAGSPRGDGEGAAKLPGRRHGCRLLAASTADDMPVLREGVKNGLCSPTPVNACTK